MDEEIKVLYVDDEPGLLEIARLFLERTGNFKVSTATAAQEALESSQIQSYDAIIADYQMPGMDGIAFLKEVRHRYGDIPFILFTGRGREEVVIAAINNGADFYLQKGGDPTAQFAELAHKIRQAVARRQADLSRIKAELALRESEERLRLFIQHAPAALAMFDREMRYLAASRRWMADYHLGDRDIIGCSHYEIFPEITEKLRDVHRRGLLGEVVSANEGKFERQDGSVQYLAWEVRPWHTIGNTVGGIIIFSEDITQRKKAEKALQKSMERLHHAIDASSDGLFDWDMERDVAYFSPRYFSMLGYAPGDLPSSFSTWTDLLHPDDHDQTISVINEYRKGTRESHIVEFRLRAKDGSWRWILSRAKITGRNAQGKPMRMIGTHTDITDRKRTEELLKESEEKYRTIFEESFDGLFITSPQGKILDMNRKGVAMFGYATKEEICSLDLERDIYASPPDRGRILAMVNAQGTAEYEVAVKKKGGETMITHCSLTAVRDEQGITTSYRGIIRDITDKKRMEEAIRESEKRYRSIIELNRAGYFRIDRDGRFVDVNNAWLTMHKYSSKDEIIGKHFSVTQVETDLGVAEQIVKDILEGKTIPPGTFS
jgi:PAS domain S-box-containing protein